jgi:hypothetical protein
MGLKVTKLEDKKEDSVAKWKANRDLFTDKEGNQVEAGDPSAAFLLARKGRELTDDQMKTHKVKKKKPAAKKTKAVSKGEDK